MCLPLAKCCCCVSLEVGAQVISIVSVVLSSVILLVYGAAVSLVQLPPVRAWTYRLLSGVAALRLGTGCLMAVGAFTKKPLYLVPWLAVSCLLVPALLSLSVLGAGCLLAAGRADRSAGLMLSAYFVYAGVQYYFACVVNSRRRELVREAEATESAHSLMGKYV